MVKAALLKNYSFDLRKNNTDNKQEDFTTLSKEKIQESLNDHIEFYDFTNTAEMIVLVGKTFDNIKYVTILNCYYDENYLTQAFFVEHEDNDAPHDKFLIVKRKILNDDTYTFTDFNPEHPDVDKYQFEDVSVDDIISIVRKKYIHDGILLKVDGTIEQVEYLDSYNKENNVGTITVFRKVEGQPNFIDYKYLNLCSLSYKYHENNLDESKFSDHITQKLDETSAQYIYSQIDLSMALLNCYYESVALTKNSVMSKILKDDVYGNVLVGLENHLNDESRELDLNINVFDKIQKLVSMKSYKRKNKYFCNIYYELASL